MIRGAQAQGQSNWSEAQLQALVVDAAKALGLGIYHTYDSRKSQPGFPDLVIVGKNGVLFRELKASKGKVSASQTFWLDILEAAGEDSGVWRPEHWPETILSEMRALGKVEISAPQPSPAQVRKQYAREDKRAADRRRTEQRLRERRKQMGFS